MRAPCKIHSALIIINKWRGQGGANISLERIILEPNERKLERGYPAPGTRNSRRIQGQASNSDAARSRLYAFECTHNGKASVAVYAQVAEVINRRGYAYDVYSHAGSGG